MDRSVLSFAIQVEEARGLSFKRLPIFCTDEEMEEYQAAYEVEVRQRGMMMGLKWASEVCGPLMTVAGFHHGLLTVYANHDQSVSQFLPPLTIQEEVRQVLAILDRMITWLEGVLQA